jgi:2-oxoglutarate dehydrogenase E1 component
MLLKQVHELLLGADDFYEAVFRAIGVPYEAVRWRQDSNPVDHDSAQVVKQMQVSTLINMHRVRGHLIADLDPLAAKPPEMHPELDPATYGLTIWDLAAFFRGDVGIYAAVAARRCRSATCTSARAMPTVGIEYMHPGARRKRWIQESRRRTSAPSRTNATSRSAPRALESSWAPAPARSGSGGGESLIPILDAILEQAADHGSTPVLGMSHRAG